VKKPMNSITKNNALKDRSKKVYGIEEVYIVPSFETENIPNGFTTSKVLDNKGCKLELRNAKFVLRSDVEQDDVFKQIIPMTVIKDSYQNYFVVERTKPAKDIRMLNAPLSILIGGHINPVDGYSDNFERCLTRHLKKDTTFKTIPYFGRSFYGLVKDEKSNLSDHIGYIFFTTVTNCYKSLLETRPCSGLNYLWMSKDKLMAEMNNFDSWSRLIISHILFVDRKDTIQWKQTTALS
jgi:predicted NUDIX family phosphoesterase